MKAQDYKHFIKSIYLNVIIKKPVSSFKVVNYGSEEVDSSTAIPP